MDSRGKIISAAIAVFAEKGKHGAHMEEIAARAKINKAMPYYFFTTKENLYCEALKYILLDVQQRIIKGVDAVIRVTNDPAEILKAIVRSHFDAYAENLSNTKILVEAFATEPEIIHKVIEQLHHEGVRNRHTPEDLAKFIEKGIATGKFRRINPKQVMISIIGMNMICLSSRHISQILLHTNAQDEKKFLEERKESIIDLLLYGIMNTRSA